MDPPNWQYVSETFKHLKPLYTKNVRSTEDDIIASVDDETLFGYVEWDIHESNKHKEKFSKMMPMFKNIEVSRNDICDYTRDYDENNKLLSTRDTRW